MELVIYGWSFIYRLQTSTTASTRAHDGFVKKPYEASIISGSNNHETYVMTKFI